MAGRFAWMALLLALPACGVIVGVHDLEVDSITTTPGEDGGITPLRDGGTASPPPKDANGVDAADAAPPYDLTGSWKGSFVPAGSFIGGAGTGTLTQTGNQVTGSISVGGSCINGASVAATLRGYGFDGHLTVDTTVDAEIDGMVSADANTINGNFKLVKGPGGTCGAGETGTFRVTRQ
jgi:hypothetical protein